MKKTYFIFASIIMAMLVSCSSGTDTNTKEITPTSTEFTSGDLAKYIEVVDEPSELTFVEKDGAIATQYIRLKVTLQLRRDCSITKNADPHDIDFAGLLSVAIINLVDESGTEVQDLSIKDEDLLKLKKLLTGDEGDTEEIIFEGEFHNHDDAPKWFKDAVQFTPYLTADFAMGTGRTTIEIDDNVISDMEEDDDFDTYGISDSEDWDALLDSYEKYVDKYISFAKKAATGDMDALTEYPALMEKAQELSDKMEDAKGEMSASQWRRYMEITNKMATAAL